MAPSLEGDLGMSQPGAAPDVKSRRLEAALAALASLAMFTPVGKGAKGLAAALGVGGGLTLASGALEAAQKKKAAAAAPAEAQPSVMSATSPTEVQDEHTERLKALQGQLQTWQQKLQTGPPKAETQAVVNDLNKQIKEIADARAKKTKGAEDYQKALKSEDDLMTYRKIGGGAGLGLGALAALLSRGRVKGAVRGFETAAEDASKLMKEPGNLVVAKGGRGSSMQSAVNEAYTHGGAPTPLPPMQGVYGATNQAELGAAKKGFAERAAKVPPSSPFSKTNAHEVSSLHPALEYAPYAAGLGEAGVSYGMSLGADNPDEARNFRNLAQGGLLGAASFGVARKGLGMLLANGRPSAGAAKVVNAGRERLQNDVQSVGLKDLKTYNKQIGDISTAGLPTPKPPGEFKPRDAAGMAELRNLKSSKGQARADFVGNAHANDAIIQAHARSVGPDGLVNRPMFRKELRQILGNQMSHAGQTVKVDDNMVRELLKAFGSR